MTTTTATKVRLDWTTRYALTNVFLAVNAQDQLRRLQHTAPGTEVDLRDWV